MPVIRYEQQIFPQWSEVEYYEITRLCVNEKLRLPRKSLREKIFIGEGLCQVSSAGKHRLLGAGDILDADQEVQIAGTLSPALLIRIGGHWGDEIGGCGVFTLHRSDHPVNTGDATSYPRNTQFDNHFHDCDEYWILFAGRGEVVSEGQFFTVQAGDCVATRAGVHHDVPRIDETVKGVYFETSLYGGKRKGHLWNHTHRSGLNSDKKSVP